MVNLPMVGYGNIREGEKQGGRTSLLSSLFLESPGGSELSPPCSEVVLGVKDCRGLRPIVIEGGGGGHRCCCPRALWLFRSGDCAGP